jgi:hypothetical protein
MLLDMPQEGNVAKDACNEPKQRPRSRRAALMTAGILAAGLVVAACSGGPSTPGAATGSTTTTLSSVSGKTDGTGVLAYSSCMRSHGVPSFPDPGSNGGIDNKRAVVSALQAVSNAQATAAQDACAHVLPPGESLGGQTVQTIPTRDQQDYLNAAACMRSHGLTNFPDPVFSGGSVSFPIPSSIDTSSTQFTQARQTCEKLIPAGLPDSGSRG